MLEEDEYKRGYTCDLCKRTRGVQLIGLEHYLCGGIYHVCRQCCAMIDDRPRYYGCNVCNRSFNKAEIVEVPLSNSTDRGFLCHMCGMAFLHAVMGADELKKLFKC